MASLNVAAGAISRGLRAPVQPAGLCLQPAGARKRKQHAQQRDAQEQARREMANMLSTGACCFLVTHSRSRAGTALCRSAAPCSVVADLKSLASHGVMGQHGLEALPILGPCLD